MVDHGPRVGHDQLPDTGQRRVEVRPLPRPLRFDQGKRGGGEVLRVHLQARDRGVGVTVADGHREVLDLIVEAVSPVQRDDVTVRAVDQVAKDRAGLDSGQLVGVAHQHQVGRVLQGLEQAGQYRERDHGDFVQDHQVEWQPVVTVVPEPGAVRSPAEQPVKCRRMDGHVVVIRGQRGVTADDLP